MKKFTLDSFPDVEVSVKFSDPKEILGKLIEHLTKDQREDFFDELEELYHEDFAKRVLESQDFFYGKTFDKATEEAGLTTLYCTNKESKKIIKEIIDLTDKDNYSDPQKAKDNIDKINEFLKTLE